MTIQLTVLRRSVNGLQMSGLYALADSGAAELIIVDEDQREFLTRLENGIFVDASKTTVTPADGVAYLNAVESFLWKTGEWDVERW